MSAGVQTYRILVGRPMVRGMVVTIRYADGYVERHASTRVGAMELGRAAVRNAMVCRCSEYGRARGARGAATVGVRRARGADHAVRDDEPDRGRGSTAPRIHPVTPEAEVRR
jgi:hypothetical protein